MHFRLGSDLTDCNVYLERAFGGRVSFTRGELLPADLATPLRFTMEVDLDTDGNPMEPRLDAYFPEESVMDKRLVAAMQAAGVDNIQTFPAVLTNARTGQVINDYFVVNVVGLVACANIEESETEPLADVYYFHNLVIDPKKTRGMLLFRLAESQMEIIIDEKVARAIENGRFIGLVLEPLAEA
jgi:hypothetical protein